VISSGGGAGVAVGPRGGVIVGVAFAVLVGEALVLACAAHPAITSAARHPSASGTSQPRPLRRARVALRPPRSFVSALVAALPLPHRMFFYPLAVLCPRGANDPIKRAVT
jgi:hypothetical protein